MRQSATYKEVRQRRGMDAKRLESLALRYVGRYSTTRAKLRDYLLRKLGEADWEGETAPDPDALVARMAEFGYVDDQVFAEQRGAALGRRGFGTRRIGMAFRAAGIATEDGAGALATAQETALEAALTLARRRRIGPYAAEVPDRPGREKAIGILIRGGHDSALARRIVMCLPGEIPVE